MLELSNASVREKLIEMTRELEQKSFLLDLEKSTKQLETVMDSSPKFFDLIYKLEG